MALIIDVETIGLPERGTSKFNDTPAYNLLDKYDGARMVQITMMLCNEQFEQIELLDFIVKADGFTIENSEFHGITNEISLERGIPFGEIALILSDKLKHVSHIMAHNAIFDVCIIKSELHRLGMDSIIEEMNSKKVVCTMKLTKSLVGAKNKFDKIKPPSLAELYAFTFNEPISNAHNSNYDVINLYNSIKHLRDTQQLKMTAKFCYGLEANQHLIEVKQSPLSNLRLNELKEKCKELGLKKYSKMNKAQLIELLESVQE